MILFFNSLNKHITFCYNTLFLLVISQLMSKPNLLQWFFCCKAQSLKYTTLSKNKELSVLQQRVTILYLLKSSWFQLPVNRVCGVIIVRFV